MIPGVPSDNTTLLEVLKELADRGFEASMWVAADGKLRCEGCEAEIEPSALVVHEYRRMEGASDPDDMLVVAAVECPKCGTKASIVMHYGPESSPEDMDVLRHLERAAPH